MHTQLFKFLQNLKSAILYLPIFRKSPTTFVTPLDTLGVLQWYFISHETKDYPGDCRFSPVHYCCSLCIHTTTLL